MITKLNDFKKHKAINENHENEPFVTHGTYTVSNAIGYEIMLSASGDAAKIKYTKADETVDISDWLPIEYVENPDAEHDDDKLEPVIDPNGYNIPLNQVMMVESFTESVNESVGATMEYPMSKWDEILRSKKAKGYKEVQAPKLKTIKLTYVDKESNTNKYYTMQELPNGKFSVNYGRIGKFNDSKINESSLAELEAAAEAKGVRNLYREMMDGAFPSLTDNPWYYAEMNFPPEAFQGLTGGEMGNKNLFQNIDSMLDMCDLGQWTKDEWRLFFQIVREEGI